MPIFRPDLPRAEALAPLLAEIDATRTYSNRGPLVGRLESALAAALGPGLNLVTASSGTAALAGAILARAGRARPERSLCLCPAHTFVGTAAAILHCGYDLHLIDVEASGELRPEALLRHPRLDEAALVVPVAPYGQAPRPAAWARWEADTGVPVVIDAAASFEALVDAPEEMRSVPVALSFHATKMFSTAEGGAVVCGDSALAAAAARALNFGFLGERVSRGDSLNGKMSEYHAAVGLASLAAWPQTRARFARTTTAYRAHAEAAGLAARLLTAPHIASNYVLYAAETAAEAACVRAALSREAIEHRAWYGGGLQAQPALAEAARDATPITDSLSARLVGLPTAADLPGDTIARIVQIVAKAVASAAARASVEP